MEMFEKILVALDFSAYSQKIFDCIGEIPGVRDVVLIHVVDATHPSKLGWTHEPYIENAKLRMAEKKEALERLGLTVHISVDVIVDVITQGTVPQAILDAAEAHSVSLIVMGARGINPIQELLLGSVSSSVLRHAGTSVLVLHFRPAPGEGAGPACPPDTPLFSRVLVPTDFSRPAEDTFSFVRSIPGIDEMILLNVVDKGESKEEIETAVLDAKMKLTAMKEECGASGIPATIRVRVGDPTEMALAVAEEDDVSLIAISAFGTGRVREMLLGSTTFTIVRRTRRPILVIRTGLSPDS
ncbi:MAG TPA: universal stress protein [Methanoregulaceae archaeon]|nr:universal stress protein [Methanoregulaceae archaeon]